MKLRLIIARVVTLIASVSFTTPLLANLSTAGAVTERSQRQTDFQVFLAAEKKIVSQLREQHATWQALKESVAVYQGDVVRYTLRGKNNSNRFVEGLVITQAIPKQTTYILNSITAQNNEAKITYSIDNGKSFVEKPLIQTVANGRVKIRSAPAKLYTHLRWSFSKSISPAKVVSATYQVKIH